MMAGLLDMGAPAGGGLLGASWDDPKTMAAFTLAAGLLGGRTVGEGLGRGLLGYQQTMDSAQERQMRGLLGKAQIDNYQANAALDRQKLLQSQDAMARRAQFLGLPNATGTGLPSTGTALPAGGGAPATAATAQQVSDKFGIPIEAIIYDYENNGGKGIADLIAKSQEVKSIAAGGYLTKGNNVQQYLPNPEKGIGYDNAGNVIALPGAAAAQAGIAGAVANAQESAKSRNSIEEVYDPVSQRTVKVSRATVLGQPAGDYRTEKGALAQTQGIQGGSVPRIDSEIAQIDLQLANTRDPSARADLMGYRQALMSQRGSYFPGAPASGNLSASPPISSLGFPSGPSASEQAANEAARTRAVNTASADVVRDTAAQAKTKSAGETVGAADRALELLRQNPTASGAGALADRAGAFFGMSSRGGEVAAQLDVVAADLIKNVPRFEGPQSDKDVEQYKSAAGRVADREIPVARRIAAAEEVKRLQQKAAGQQPQQSSSSTMASLPPAGTYKGRRIRDTQTGKILVSNGMQWKEE